MPRSARVQYEGARYHVITRGNYRKDLSRGWYIGSIEGKQTLREQIGKGAAKANAEVRRRLGPSESGRCLASA